MSSDQHIDNWIKLKSALFAEVPVKVAGFALVAVAENGELFWGADYTEGRDALQRGLAMIVRDMKETKLGKAVAA